MGAYALEISGAAFGQSCERFEAMVCWLEGQQARELTHGEADTGGRIRLTMTRSAVRSLAFFAALLMVSGCSKTPVDVNDDPPQLVFAASPSDHFAALQESYQPILEMLKKETSREILFQTDTDEASIIEGLRTGKIDIAALDPFFYVLAKRRGAPITVVAAGTDEKGKSSGYQSYGITWAGSPIRTLADLRGKRICFVDLESASGYLYPSAELRTLGIDPARDITPIFKNHHDAVVVAVATDQCDAGFAADWMVDRQLTEIMQGRLRADRITIVWKSGTIPGPPIAISDRVAPELHRPLKAALQDKANTDDLRTKGFCQGKCVLGDGLEYGYQRADDARYDDVRSLCAMVEHNRCTSA